jgi:MFS transporter, PPP family, 3-phenylpropionic acid transporter
MPAGSAAFLLFFAIIYMNIAAITFMAFALLTRGLSPAQTGLVLGVLPVVQVVTQPVWGVLADKTGQTKRLLTLACAGLVVASVGLWVARGFVVLLLAMFAVAVMRAGILPLVTAMALTHLGPKDRGFGRIRLWGSLGFSIAVFLIGWKVAQPHPELIPPIHAVLALAATAVAALLPRDTRPVAPSGLQFRHLTAAPGLGPLVAAAALTGMGMGVNNTFLAVFVRDLGGPAWILGAAFAIAAMGEVPLMANMQHLIHRFGVSRLVSVGLLVLPLRWGLYALLHSPWPILPLQLLHSVAIACLEVGGVLLVRDLTRPEWSATAQAFYGAALMGLGPSAGTVMAGMIYEWRGLHMAFGLTVIPALAAWLLFAGLSPHRRER